MANLFTQVMSPVELLFQIKTVADVNDIIAATPGATWRSLGNRENNAPTVNVGQDSADALLERATNSMDALIERGMGLTGASGFQTPRQAVEALFGIPHGRLVNLDDKRKRELAKKLVITLRDSGVKKYPTVVVEDQGIGQHPDDFPKTLLSLNESNKAERLELMGAFGQGGSAVYAFATYALFISRRDPVLLKKGQQDLVGWSIVRFNELNETHKTGRYEYLVVPDERGQLQVPRFAPTELPDEYRDFVGCHFVAVHYELDRYDDAIHRPHGSMWHLLYTGLFDTIYPILLKGERPQDIKANPENSARGIVIHGNASRLEADKNHNIEHSDSLRVDLGDDGTVMVRYYVLKDTGDKSKNWSSIRGYIVGDQTVTVTLNGQRQGTMRRDIFDKLGLMTIAKQIIVQVECDGLTRRAKWQLFSSTRDRIKNNAIRERLEEGLRTALASDSRLRELDRERKRRALAQQSSAEAKKINEWLRDEIKSLRQGMQPVYRKVISTNTEYQLLGSQPLLDDAGTSTNNSEKTEEAVLTNPPAEPTTIRVLNPTIRVPEGGTGVVRLAMDAPDDFVSPEQGVGTGSFSAKFTKGADLFRLTAFSPIRRGVLRATIAVAKGVPAGEKGRVIFAVAKPDGLPLLVEADVVTVEAPQLRVKPAGMRLAPENGPEVKAIGRDGWINDLSLPIDLVAKVEENPETQGVTIYVFQEYPKLMERLKQRRTDDEQIVQYQSKFVAAMALAAWLQEEDQKKSQEVINQQFLEAELRRAADLFIFSQFVGKAE